ncbi:MAG: hypothetical protein M0036_05095 [Desulfobacteraceae bacterium]|nr:hypothetical protein [Desulfobacteraceae bacterium]
MISIAYDDQKEVNQLRIDLAQAAVDLAEVRANDTAGRAAKEKVSEGLRALGRRMDRLGLKHSCALRCDNQRCSHG